MSKRDPTGNDAHWMREAAAEAGRGLGRTAPNPAVGCVIVRDGREVGRGYHRRAGRAHAEVEALTAAGKRAFGATAYVTLEPCCRHGRTPPCTQGLLEAGIARVVVGCLDPNPAVSGRGVALLRRRGVATETGVEKELCRILIRGFAEHVRFGRPWVHLKLAASLDGRIASRSGESKWISSSASRRLVHGLRARSEAILVGVGTVLADDPRLTCRLRGGANPVRVVLDRRLRTPPRCRVVEGPGRSLIVCAPSASPRARGRLEAAGAEVLAMDTRGRRGWLRLLAELGRRDVMELLIEGGATVAAAAVRATVVNRATIFYNPRFIGGDGVPMLESLGVKRPAEAIRLRTESWSSVGSDLVWSGELE